MLMSRPLIVGLSLAALLAAGCGTDETENPGSTGSPSPEEVSKPITAKQVIALRLGTPRVEVVERIGPPVREDEEVKQAGVIDRCYRYRGLDRTDQIDPDMEYRLCYDDRDRLSVKSTAPVD